LLNQSQWAEVVRVIRTGVRWLQGREKETGWDTMEDDREFDEERKVREGWEKGNTWFEEEATYELDVRLRCRLGLARLGMGRPLEAQVSLFPPFLSPS
jgi:general transcription factor 3C polypeptide 3 (transcription factor C subunit 4)